MLSLLSCSGVAAVVHGRRPERLNGLAEREGHLWGDIPTEARCVEPVGLLLCEFARKKENPPLERFIASPFEQFIVSLLLPTEALSTLRSFSAERPVIRGRGRSHALKLLMRS
jgi:hypothetical protein